MHTFNIVDCKYIGGGDIKSIFLVSSDIVVTIPNGLDRQFLADTWPRIINEELELSSLLTKIGIPTLKWEKCNVIMKNGTVLPTIMTKSFESYKNDGIYIIDTKCKNSTTWQNDGILNLIPEGTDVYDFELWKKLTLPLATDINNLIINNICLVNDTLNLTFVSKDSVWHSGSDLPYEIRLFAFGLSSKSCMMTLNDRRKVSYSQSLSMLKHVCEFAIWNAIYPNSYVFNNKQIVLFKQMVDYYGKNQPNYNDKNIDKNIDKKSCIIC